MPVSIAVLLIVALSVPAFAQGQAPAGSVPPGAKIPAYRVAFVIAPEKFRDEELFVPLAGVQKGGYGTLIASTKKGTAVGMLGGKAEAEVLIDDLVADDLLALVIVGGAGSPVHLWSHVGLQELARKMAAAGKPVAAICLSPVVLARAGLLKGRKATVWKADEAVAELKKGGAAYADAPCLEDGLLVTGNGPAAAASFTAAILNRLPPVP